MTFVIEKMLFFETCRQQSVNCYHFFDTCLSPTLLYECIRWQQQLSFIFGVNVSSCHDSDKMMIETINTSDKETISLVSHQTRLTRISWQTQLIMITSVQACKLSQWVSVLCKILHNKTIFDHIITSELGTSPPTVFYSQRNYRTRLQVSDY